ncbi:MAG: SDR family oxidoreductase [Sterolibacterium sp.]
MRYRSIFRPDLFSGQVIIVTGSGSGIGRCTVHELASLGASLALIGRKPEKLEKVCAEIGETYPAARITYHPCDIRDEERVKATVAEILAAHGRIDGLVNNAGGQFRAPVETISLRGWEAVVKNNLTGGFLMSRECYNQWMKDNGGAIVNIIADMFFGMPGMAHSGAARAGMLNFTETAACEWGWAGVRLNAVAPGFIASSGLETYDDDRKKEHEQLSEKVPLQRFGVEAEVSAAIIFLLSEAASYITGTCLRVDGGVPNSRHTWKLVGHSRSRPYDGFPLYRIPEHFSNR